MENNMTIDEINDELRKVYEDYYKELNVKKDLLSRNETKASSPLFMNVFNEYSKMDKKILVVGQETNSWCKTLGEFGVEELMSFYEDFALAQRVEKDDGTYYHLNSRFWNFSRKFFSQINRVSRKEKGFLWSNISKFDINSNTPNNEIIEANPEGFLLLNREVQIIKPDIVLFLTGKKYNNQIEKYLGLNFDVNFKTEKTYIKKLIGNHAFFPENTFQIEHPNTLHWMGQYNIINNKLVELCEDK